MKKTKIGHSLVERGGLVESLWHAVNHGAASLVNIPGLVRRVIETEAWKERNYDGEVWRNSTFLDFIVTKPMQGCGWPPEKIEALIKDDPEILSMWRKAITPPKHKHHDSDNVTITDRGNSRSYTLVRLERERPDLYRKVLAKELSPNAAAIKAGFRERTFVVPLDPKRAAIAIRRHFNKKQVEELGKELRRVKKLCV